MSFVLVGLALSAVSVAVAARGAYVQSKTNKAIAELNAAGAEDQAKQIKASGDRAAADAIRRARSIAASQRAAFAARGLDLSGTAQDIVDQTEFFGALDAETARESAAHGARGARLRGAGATLAANAENPWQAAGTTLLSGASTVASRWYAGGGSGGSSSPSNTNTAGREKYNFFE